MARIPMMDVNLILDLRRKKPQAIHVQSFHNPTTGSEMAAIRATPIYTDEKFVGLKYDIVQSIGSLAKISFNDQAPPQLLSISDEPYDWIIKINCKLVEGLNSCEINHSNLNLLENKDRLDVQFNIEAGGGFGAPPGICRVILYR